MALLIKIPSTILMSEWKFAETVHCQIISHVRDVGKLNKKIFLYTTRHNSIQMSVGIT